MTEELYLEQVRLEEEARGLTIQRFIKEHTKATTKSTFAETTIGSHLITQYLMPLSAGIDEWLAKADSGKAGPKVLAAKHLKLIDSSTSAFLFLKALINSTGYETSRTNVPFTYLAMSGAGLIHDEMRLRMFENEHKNLSRKIHKDFAARELPRHKREEYMRKTFTRHNLEWSIWSKTDLIHIGTVLLSIFEKVTGDIKIVTRGFGRKKKVCIEFSEGIYNAIKNSSDACAPLMSVYPPTIIPPRPWTEDSLESGGYHSLNVTPYTLVKHVSSEYKQVLQEAGKRGDLDRLLLAINALQNTAWAINLPVVEALEYVYANDIPCGKLPTSSLVKPDEPPAALRGLTKTEILAHPKEHPLRKMFFDYQVYRFKIHEYNRRSVGKRVLAQRSFHLARKYSAYDAIYFPHDLDSRGRSYPKASCLNPQGPDYVKGLLKFSEAKELGQDGLYWLGVHGANCWGEDKVPMDERADWAVGEIERATYIAMDPTQDLTWLKADSPAQYLAWCLEWAEVWSGDCAPEEYRSHIHVDLDATCSGLQHFSGMLRDEVGGHHVNMVPSSTRQDVYNAVATAATTLVEEDLHGPDRALAQAWQEFGITRKICKRPVMVKPYSGTRTSCSKYVGEGVQDRLIAGEPVPWPKDDLWAFKVYGSDKIWQAIPSVVVAAEGAMKWLSKMSVLASKSQPEKLRIEWTTPMGLPVWVSKLNKKSRLINTHFDGRRYQPRLTFATEKLDGRQMGSTVAPSFVHSLDAAHMQATISAASTAGISSFAVVHDSFGVHACEVEKFTHIIREQFVKMYTDHDVLQEFADSVTPLISSKYQDNIPPLPPKGSLDLEGILNNEFFFS